MNNNKLLTGKDVQDRLRISRVTLYNWVKAGKIKQVRLTDRAVRYEEDEVSKLIKKAS